MWPWSSRGPGTEVEVKTKRRVKWIRMVFERSTPVTVEVQDVTFLKWWFSPYWTKGSKSNFLESLSKTYRMTNWLIDTGYLPTRYTLILLWLHWYTRPLSSHLNLQGVTFPFFHGLSIRVPMGHLFLLTLFYSLGLSYVVFFLKSHLFYFPFCFHRL